VYLYFGLERGRLRHVLAVGAAAARAGLAGLPREFAAVHGLMLVKPAFCSCRTIAPDAPPQIARAEGGIEPQQTAEGVRACAIEPN
jgi:hypothetical protein